MADIQAQAAEGVSSLAEANSSAFSSQSGDTTPPPPPAAAAVAQDANTPLSEPSIPNQHFCAYAICLNHNYNDNNSSPSNGTGTGISSAPPPTIPNKPCPKCHTVTYCSRPCQKAHWKSHKKSCAVAAQQRLSEDTDAVVQQSARRKVPLRDKGQGQRLRKWQFDT